MKNLGVLCHITSLPSKFGLGDFGSECYNFIDYLKKQNIAIWQILPLNNTNVFNCPYGTMSTHTFDEMFVDLTQLVNENLISNKDLAILIKHKKSKKIDYNFVKPIKLQLFKKAYSQIDDNYLNEIEKFAKKNRFVFCYAYYKSLLEVFNANTWYDIDKKYWDINGKQAKTFIKQNKTIFNKYVFYQYVLSKQWKKIKEYANKQGIKILGDLPIYCEKESVDVFSNPQCFKLDKNLKPYVTGGCPPDVFSSAGQDWGTCVYDWKELERSNYDYIINRILNQKEKYDILRLDHYAGLVEHYENSKIKNLKSKWVKGGGEQFFNKLKQNINLNNFVVEDLGFLSNECKKIKQQFNLKGMAVLQFAFDGSESNPYLPYNVKGNAIYYLGTHDNNTFIGFLNSCNEEKLRLIKKLLKSKAKTKNQLLIDSVKNMLNSNCDTVILQIQDFLKQNENYRMNVPGIAEHCWDYVVPKNYKTIMTKTLKEINYKKQKWYNSLIKII